MSYSLDSGLRYLLTEDEVNGRNKFKPLKSMVKEGSLGALLIEKIPNLGERERHEDTFNQPLQSPLLWEDSRSLALAELMADGITKVSEALAITPEEFNKFKQGRLIVNRLTEYLARLSVTPQARLLEEVFQTIQEAVPPHVERRVIDGVNAAISEFTKERKHKQSALTEKELAVLALRFGFEGIVLNQHQIGKKLGVEWYGKPISCQRVRDLEKEAIRDLRWPGRKSVLKSYCSTSSDSLGRKVFGVYIFEDYPVFIREGKLDDLNLSGNTLAELVYRYPNLYHGTNVNLSDIISVPLQDLSQSAKDEIEYKVRKLKEEDAIKEALENTLSQSSLPQAGDIFVRQKEPVNAFLPEISIPEETLENLSKIPLGKLNIRRVIYYSLMRILRDKCIVNPTAADIFRLRISEVQNFRQCGIKSAFEFGIKIEELLSLTDDICPKGLIPTLLAKLASSSTKRNRGLTKHEKGTIRDIFIEKYEGSNLEYFETLI